MKVLLNSLHLNGHPLAIGFHLQTRKLGAPCSAYTKTGNNETKPPKRNDRNERNERNETAETTETSETKRNHRNK